MAAAVGFLRDEYRVDNLIASYVKPFMAIMNGFVLGGGIGLSGHASHRVVTDDSTLGMPEVSIGLTPDVGGSRLLSRAPRELGTYLALTALTASATEAIELGLADAIVPVDRLSFLIASLEQVAADEAVARYRLRDSGCPGGVARPGGCRDRRTHRNQVAHRGGCDLGVDASRSRAAHPEACFDQELRIMAHALAHPDFREGVRARMIDKDRTPHWAPATFEV